MKRKVGRLVKFITWETSCEGRVDLNTFERTNEFAHTLLMEYTRSIVRALLHGDRTGWNGATLQSPGSDVSCGKFTQTRTFENHANLLPYLSNWPLYTWRKHQDGLFPCMHLLLEKYARAGSISKHGTCTVDCTTTCMGMSVVRLRSMKSSLPSTSLMDELLQTLSNNLPYCKQQKTRRGLGTRPYSYTPMKPLNSQMTTFIANNKGQGANLFVNNQTL